MLRPLLNCRAVFLPLLVLLGAPIPVAQSADFGPPAGQSWQPIAELTDEFDGPSLDASKWHATNPTWKGRQPGLFRAENVALRDGCLELTMRNEDVPDAPKGYHTYTCAAVKSKTPVLYGYFEARCRPMDSRGSSAFWFYNAQPEQWTEIDVFEIGGGDPRNEKIVHTNVHVFRTPTVKKHLSNAGQWKAPERLAEAFHVYAVEWNKEKIRFFFDGRLLREIENTHWHQPLYLNFDSETMPKWFGLPEVKNLPSTFRTDYVRAWKAVEK